MLKTYAPNALLSSQYKWTLILYILLQLDKSVVALDVELSHCKMQKSMHCKCSVRVNVFAANASQLGQASKGKA